MNKLPKIVGITLCVLFILYLLIPGPAFPPPPPDAVQSEEKADQETPLRRAYFTNFTRQEVVDYYRGAFGKSLITPLPSIRLNYPPEDAQTLIRDQTRSTFLEEIAHPFRESIYINGFEPKDPKDDVWYKGVDYRQKIIVKYNPSSLFARIPIAALTLAAAYFLIKEWIYGHA